MSLQVWAWGSACGKADEQDDLGRDATLAVTGNTVNGQNLNVSTCYVCSVVIEDLEL